MQIRNLGGSGLRVSAVGLGCNNFGQRTDLETSRKVIHKAIDLGITLFDTADIYAVWAAPRPCWAKCSAIAARTSCWRPNLQADGEDGTKQGASRRYIMFAVEASLKRLKTDYIDLYQQHDYDPLTPIEETLRALDDLVRQGKVRYSAIRISRPGASRRPNSPRAMNVSRFTHARTNTASWCARSNRICCPQPANTSSACCRSSRWQAAC